jgi:hypothetical protein
VTDPATPSSQFSESCLLAQWDRFRLPFPRPTFLHVVKPLPAFTTHIQVPGSRHGSPLAPSNGMFLTSTHSIPAPLAAILPLSHLSKMPGTPISPDTLEHVDVVEPPLHHHPYEQSQASSGLLGVELGSGSRPHTPHQGLAPVQVQAHHTVMVQPNLAGNASNKLDSWSLPPTSPLGF